MPRAQGRAWRAALWIAAALAGGLSAQGAAAQDATAPDRNLSFTVMRNGSVIGHHDVTFRHDGGKLIVDIDVSIKVDAMFVTVFRYTQQREETWQGGRLIAFASHTNNDGELYDNSGAAGPGGITVTSGAATWTLPADSLPIGYWDAAMVKRGPLFDTVTGKPVVAAATAVGEETIEAAGRRITATHYRLEGPQPRDLWYDAQGRWVKMRARGRDGSIAEWILK
ncbi:MAG TPA: DUF6134 family protein [Alphaproteobacteria bacterium]|nr:DUF6134 family protein [Alphaproteobacteria bacterium]